MQCCIVVVIYCRVPVRRNASVFPSVNNCCRLICARYAAEMPLLRKLPPAYGDGTYKPSGGQRPNPIEISEQLMNGTNGKFSKTGKSALLVFFGKNWAEIPAPNSLAASQTPSFKLPEYQRNSQLRTPHGSLANSQLQTLWVPAEFLSYSQLLRCSGFQLSEIVTIYY